MTSTVRVEAHNADVEVRVIEGSRTRISRAVARHVVRDGEAAEFHVWGNHWVEVAEVPQ